MSDREDSTAASDSDATGHDPEAAGDDANDGDDGGLSEGVAILVSTLVGFAVAVVAYWWVGGWAGNEVFFEQLFRVQPTVEGGGVGTDWVLGNTVPWLDALIAIVHAADVLMGVFILGIMFLHWAIFRRLAGRMRRPVDRQTGEAMATDGGEAARKGGEQR